MIVDQTSDQIVSTVISAFKDFESLDDATTVPVKVFKHKDFANHKNLFIDRCIHAKDSQDGPCLFLLEYPALSETFKFIAQESISIQKKVFEAVHSKSNKTIVHHLLDQLENENFDKDILPVLEVLAVQLTRFVQKDIINEGFINKLCEKTSDTKVALIIIDKMEELKIINNIDYLKLLISVAGKNKVDLEKMKALSEKQKRRIYDIAYLHENIHVYEPANYPITGNRYSINLTWINKDKTLSSCIKGDKQEFIDKILKPAADWAAKNPGALINIWYDSQLLLNPKAIQNSIDVIKTQYSQYNIQLRDIRKLPIVHQCKEVFDPEIPVYFRVDLLRAIAGDHESKSRQFFIHADLDMSGIESKQLFDQRTVSFLNEYGIVMAKGGAWGYENGFQILNGHHKQFIESHRKIIINGGIYLARKKHRNWMKISPQQIYDLYPPMFLHFVLNDKNLQNIYGKITQEDSSKLEGLEKSFVDDQENYISKSNKVKVFDYSRFKINVGIGSCKVKFDKKHWKSKKDAPMKPVLLPDSHFLGLG